MSLNLNRLPPLEQGRVIWEHNGTFYTPRQLRGNPDALSSLENAVRTGEITRDKAMEIAKKRALNAWSGDDGPVLARNIYEGKAQWSREELREEIQNETDMGMKWIQTELRRLQNLIGRLR